MRGLEKGLYVEQAKQKRGFSFTLGLFLSYFVLCHCACSNLSSSPSHLLLFYSSDLPLFISYFTDVFVCVCFFVIHSRVVLP
jgi:hypothetical protein